MPARDDDDKRRGLRFLSILYSRWPAILQLLVAAMGAACLAAYSVRRWGAVPAEDVLSSELDTVVSVGKMGNVGGREVREERVEPQPEVLLTFEELDNEDDTEDNEDNEDTEEKSLKDLEPLEPEENGAVDRKKIEAAEMRNVEETESLARTYKKLNPGAEISRMAAVQLKMNLCGSFVQQRLQMISILMIGLFLGAQVVLPSEIGSQQRPLGDILDLEQIKQSMQKVYARHWCSRRLLHSFDEKFSAGDL